MLNLKRLTDEEFKELYQAVYDEEQIRKLSRRIAQQQRWDDERAARRAKEAARRLEIGDEAYEVERKAEMQHALDLLSEMGIDE